MKQKQTKKIEKNKKSLKDKSNIISISKYSFYISISITFLAAFFVFYDFLFLNKSYLFKDIASDSINGHFAIINHYYWYLKNVGFIGWSFNLGMGQNIFSLFAGLNDFSYFISYFFNENSLPYILNFTEFFKIMFGGLFFYLYLKEINLSFHSRIIGCILLPLSAFFIIGGNWLIFSSQALFLTMILYGLEKIYNKKMLWFFPLVIFLTAFNMAFNLYLFGIFIFIYTLFRFLSFEEKFDFKKLMKTYFIIFGLSIIGFLISSFFTLNVIYELINAPRVSGDSGYYGILSSVPIFSLENESTIRFGQGIPYMHLKTLILRFFSTDIMGTGMDFKGWYNYMEAPMTYVGLITLLLVPQIFQFLNKRQKIVYGTFLAFWLLLCIFPFFRYAFWAFTGDYYRIFGLFVSFALLFFALSAFSKIDSLTKVNIKTLFITLAVLLILLYYPYFSERPDIINKNIQKNVSLFLIAYTILLSLLKTKYKQYVKNLILIIVFIELVSFANISLNKRYFTNPQTGQKENAIVTKRELRRKTGFNDYTIEAVDFLKHKDNTFYRVNKDYRSGMAVHASMNDALIQGYYGTQSYNSFNQKYYINFLAGMGIINPANESETRWAQGLVSRFILQTLASTKYQLMKSPVENNSFIQMTYEPVTQFEDVKVLKNKYYLPLGFCYDKFIDKEDFKRFSDFNIKDLSLLQAIVIDEQDAPDYRKITGSFNQLMLEDTIQFNNYTWERYFEDINDLRKDTLQITYHSQNKIAGNIELETDKILFFSIPYDYGWKAKVNDKEVEINIVNFGLMGIYLTKGEHSVILSYLPPLKNISIVVTIIGLVIYLALILFLVFRKRNKKL